MEKQLKYYIKIKEIKYDIWCCLNVHVCVHTMTWSTHTWVFLKTGLKSRKISVQKSVLALTYITIISIYTNTPETHDHSCTLGMQYYEQTFTSTFIFVPILYFRAADNFSPKNRAR